MTDLQCFETSGTWIKPEWAEAADGHVLFLARPASGEHPPRVVALTFDGDRSTDEWPDMPAWAMVLMMENKDRLFDRGVAGQVSTYGGRAYVTALRGGGGGTIIWSGGAGRGGSHRIGDEIGMGKA